MAKPAEADRETVRRRFMRPLSGLREKIPTNPYPRPLRRQRRSRLLDEVAQSVQATAAPPASHAGERLSPGELAAVRGALEALPPDQQHAISLAFFGGMTHAEIAAALSEPLGTVKARIRRGMLKLRDDLEADV